MMATQPTTRQRLLDEGMRLFAQRGFRSTAVGDIEQAAGLQPRRGALYKHFASKDALLEAALRAHLDDVATGADQLGTLDPIGASGDPSLLRPLVLALGRWFLEEMDRQRNLTAVLEHEGRRLADLTAEVKTAIVDVGHRAAARFLATAVPDPEATAVLLLGALVALRRTAWTFGSAPLAIDDERALAAWTDMTLATVGAFGPAASGSP
jgi:AcrR family transcriptional regulator